MFRDLQEFTGQESGAVMYDSGEIWIGNWTGFSGLPRVFAGMTIGLGETITRAEVCRVPEEAKTAMIEHDIDNSHDIYDNDDAWCAWRVNNNTIVVVNQNWA